MVGTKLVPSMPMDGHSVMPHLRGWKGNDIVFAECMEERPPNGMSGNGLGFLLASFQIVDCDDPISAPATGWTQVLRQAQKVVCLGADHTPGNAWARSFSDTLPR